MTAPIRREPIPKQLRWKIYARDGFACRYCGAKPPEATLHIDHVHPVSLGGANEESNLVTACEVCNLSKSANPLPTPSPAPDLRVVVPIGNIPAVGAIQSELPATTKRLFEFFAEEAKVYEERGVDVAVAMPVFVMAAMDLAAWLYLRLSGSSKTKRDFMAMCATMFDEHKPK